MTAEALAAGWMKREVRWRTAHYILLTLSSVLAAVAGATALANVWSGALAGVLALTASALTAAAVSLRPAVMAAGSAAKAAKYLELARDTRKAEGRDSEQPSDFYELLERYDKIRTTPEPALPTGSE